MRKKLRILSLFSVLLAACLLAFSAGEETDAANRIPDGVFLGDTDLSGLSMNEAADAMDAYYDSISKSNLSIEVRDIPSEDLARIEAGEKLNLDSYDVLYTVDVPIADFDFDYSIEEALRYASTLGQTGKLIERYKLLMDMKYASAQLPLSYSIDGEKVKDYVENVFVPENTKDPVDAKFSYSASGLHVTRKEQSGMEVNANLTVNAILQAFENGISDEMVCSALVGTVEPSVKSGDITDITFYPVATYTTKLWSHVTDHNWNRSRNIYRAADLVNGTLVMPGERMSLNQTIGQRTEERGFYAAHAYSNGKIINEIGGGICQFATTFYNVLLKTEMTINVRYAHSMLVDYVPYSMDATLDWGNKDLVWTNSWDTPIFISCTYIDRENQASEVTVTFYSRDPRPSNRTVEYKSVTDSETKPSPTYTLDSSLNPGVATISGDLINEVSSHLDKIVRVNGSIVSTETINKDYYRPSRQTITVGTKGLSISVKYDSSSEIYKLYDGDGNQLLMNYQGQPYYDGHGGYYLAKDYKHNADGYATNTPPVRITSSQTEPAPTTTEAPSSSETTPSTEPSTEATEPSTEATEPSTEATEPPHEHSYNWAAWTHNDGSSPSSHSRTGTCSCGDTKTETYNCSFDGGVVTPPTTDSQGYTTYTCTVCGFQYRADYTDPIPTEPAPTEPEPTDEIGTDSLRDYRTNRMRLSLDLR